MTEPHSWRRGRRGHCIEEAGERPLSPTGTMQCEQPPDARLADPAALHGPEALSLGASRPHAGPLKREWVGLGWLGGGAAQPSQTNPSCLCDATESRIHPFPWSFAGASFR